MDSVYIEHRGSVGRSGGDSQGAAGIFSPIPKEKPNLEREAQEPSESTGTLTNGIIVSLLALQPSL